MAHRVDPEIFIAESHQGVIVDVRTPAEFAQGHIPGAHNIPLFTNEQRAVVGTIYKREGHDPAVQKGLEFVGPRMAGIAKQARELAAGRMIYLYCWRGGMRSGSVGWLLETAGLKVTLLAGGYKAYRRSFEHLLESQPWKFVILTGATGCGKTELLRILAQRGEQVLDLEGIANHRGSAFGGIGQGEQPTTEHFINLLHEAFRGFDPAKPIWCEGESMLVGRVYIPEILYKMLSKDVVIDVTMDRTQRLDRIMKEYGALPPEELADAFRRVSKRMGPENATNAVRLIEEGDIRSAADLGLVYYDKTYSRNHASRADVQTFTADNDDMQASVDRLIELKNRQL